MLCKIIMDEKCRNKLQVTVTVAEAIGEEMCISLYIADKMIAQANQTVLESSAQEANLLNIQAELIGLIKALIEQDYATYAGRYSKDKLKIPVFRGDNQASLYVNSVDKKTGQKLLKGQLMTNPETVRKLATWLISKFPVINQWAAMPTKMKADDAWLCQVIRRAAQQIMEPMLRASVHERNLIRLDKNPDDRPAI